MARNLRSVDLNLLPVFEAAYEERSFARAAVRLAMTQSAVSHALTRLRALYKDELFVRHPKGVTPTRVADTIYAEVRRGMAAVRESLSTSGAFDPRTSERKFIVAIPHPLGPMIATRLRTQLARAAPHLTVNYSTRSRPSELERDMREMRVDLAIDWLSLPVEHFRSTTLFEDRLVAAARSGHPALKGAMTKKTLVAQEFVCLRLRVLGEHPLPGLRAWLSLNLKVVLEVSEIVEQYMVAGDSDLFTFVPASMLDIARRTFRLAPFGWAPSRTAVPVQMQWLAAQDSDAAHAFLRRQMQAAVIHVVGSKGRANGA